MATKNKTSSLKKKSSSSSSSEALGQSAMNQILSNQKKRFTDAQLADIRAKIERSCVRFDKKGAGKLSVDEFYNVIKLQNKLDCSKDELRGFFKDLDADKDGRVAIKEFMNHPIISQHAFDLMDRNKDGYVSKGELKLAQKTMTMKELGDIIRNIDENSDGKLTYDEVRNLSKKRSTSNKRQK